MTAHTHTERVAGCYRCEISADEVELSMEIEIEDLEAENKRLHLALDLIESMTTAPVIRTHDEWREDIGAVLWAVRDIRQPE